MNSNPNPNPGLDLFKPETRVLKKEPGFANPSCYKQLPTAQLCQHSAISQRPSISSLMQAAWTQKGNE